LREDIEEPRVTMLMQSSVLTPNVKQNGFSHLDGARVARMIAFVAKAMAIAEPPKPSEVFRSDFLPAAAERKP
jgi:NitT/TauT family transport system substrate-binding protein